MTRTQCQYPKPSKSINLFKSCFQNLMTLLGKTKEPPAFLITVGNGLNSLNHKMQMSTTFDPSFSFGSCNYIKQTPLRPSSPTSTILHTWKTHPPICLFTARGGCRPAAPLRNPEASEIPRPWSSKLQRCNPFSWGCQPTACLTKAS